MMLVSVVSSALLLCFIKHNDNKYRSKWLQIFNTMMMVMMM